MEDLSRGKERVSPPGMKAYPAPPYLDSALAPIPLLRWQAAINSGGKYICECEWEVHL